jgi:hypothetical protein
MAEYPGVGVQVAERAPLTLPAGHGVTRGLRVLLADGVLPQRRVIDWVDATTDEPDGDSRPCHER